MFWNNIESSVINLSLQLDKINTARTVIHGTERLIKTALNEVDSTLKTDGGFVFNNILNERPAEETLSKGVFPIRNIDNIINAKTSSKKGLNCEKNNDVVTKQCKIEDKLQDLPIEATCTEDSKTDEKHKLDENDDRFFDDIKMTAKLIKLASKKEKKE
uniref:Uncharacterized protein n=1 Tax=Rhizophagus irregularis (strain DAOM 181602 / DAOM 197198 / MUCL 43194) TaxID=747089 RepID=U9U7J8_RHIID